MDNQEGGWIKLHRKFLDWEWYSDIVTKSVFLHLLLTANHEQKQWMGRTIERGQVVTGLYALAGALELSIRQIRTALSKLEKTGEIVKKSTNKFTIITISKYDSYQQRDVNERQTSDKRKTNERQTSDNKQEYKNIRIKEDKNNINTSTVRTDVRIPTIEEVKKYIRDKGLMVDAIEFYAYYEANGWMCGRKPMQKWKAALVSWDRKRKKASQPQPTTTTKSYNMDDYKAHMAKYEHQNAISYDEYIKRQSK